jgi:cation:H+ antiporter
MIPFAVGLVLAAIGGEMFVSGSVSLAQRLRIPSGIVAATIGAFASASPEFSVAIVAAVRGDPDISLGNAIGSNIVNLGLVLGITLLVKEIAVPRKTILRDFIAALAAPALMLALSLDGKLTRADGCLMLLIFGGWMAATVIEAARSRVDEPGQPLPKGWMTIAALATSVLLLAGAGKLLVEGALALSEALGLRAFVISSTLVAIGTDIPELAVSLAAIWRGRPDISLGAVLGSNVFNSLAVVGSAVVVRPFDAANSELRLGLAVGMLLLLCIWPSREGLIPRWRSAVLLGIYAAYVIAAGNLPQ